jgi:hypothetical protein
MIGIVEHATDWTSRPVANFNGSDGDQYPRHGSRLTCFYAVDDSHVARARAVLRRRAASLIGWDEGPLGGDSRFASTSTGRYPSMGGRRTVLNTRNFVYSLGYQSRGLLRGRFGVQATVVSSAIVAASSRAQW